MYRPYLVTKAERMCFKLSGDKLDEALKNKKREPLKKESLELYWRRSFATFEPRTA